MEAGQYPKPPKKPLTPYMRFSKSVSKIPELCRVFYFGKFLLGTFSLHMKICTTIEFENMILSPSADIVAIFHAKIRLSSPGCICFNLDKCVEHHSFLDNWVMSKIWNITLHVQIPIFSADVITRLPSFIGLHACLDWSENIIGPFKFPSWIPQLCLQ